jgi:hypothetical protein
MTFLTKEKAAMVKNTLFLVTVLSIDDLAYF